MFRCVARKVTSKSSFQQQILPRCWFNNGRSNEKVIEVPNEKIFRFVCPNYLRIYPDPCSENYSVSTGNVASSANINCWPEIFQELIAETGKVADQQTTNYIARMLKFNIGEGGKKNRLQTTINAYKTIASKTAPPTAENLRLATILGWAVELVQASGLIFDDIMDGSTTRRGKPCWYTHEDVGLNAIADGMLTVEFIYATIMRFFKDHDCYLQIMEACHKAYSITIIGQIMDVRMANTSVYDFSMESYKNIIYNKSAYYSAYLPVQLALILDGCKDRTAFRNAKTVLLELGCFFQIQDDFLDCYGDPKVIGKIGTDIQEGKCTWLAIKFMEQANPEQVKLFAKAYGSKDPQDVAQVKQLYEDLELKKTFQCCEEEFLVSMKKLIRENQSGAVPEELYFDILKTISKRKF